MWKRFCFLGILLLAEGAFAAVDSISIRFNEFGKIQGVFTGQSSFFEESPSTSEDPSEETGKIDLFESDEGTSLAEETTPTCSKSSPENCATETECSAAEAYWCPWTMVCVVNEDKCFCADEGKMHFLREIPYCCKDGWRADLDEEGVSTGYINFDTSSCGCPTDDGKTVYAQGDGTCCSNYKTYNPTTKAYDKPEEVCGCPDYSEWNKEKDACVCSNPEMTMDEAYTACVCKNGGTYREAEGKCIICSADSDCSGNTPYCLTSANDGAGQCVQCLSGAHCGACEKGNNICDTSSYNGTYTCLSCASLNAAKPFRGADPTDSTQCNLCYECVADSDCASGICSDNVCEKCVPGTASESEDNIDRGCTAEAPICLNKAACVACAKDSDCRTSEQPRCQLSSHTCVECLENRDCPNTRGNCLASGVCSVDCGDATWDETRQACSCTGSTPVWNPSERKCVVCYNTISENWTDLGCGTIKTAAKYSEDDVGPREDVKKPICLTDTKEESHKLGYCVECVTDRHCESNKVCTDNACGCPTNKPTWNGDSKKCIACNANYNGTATSGTTSACGSDKPKCNTDNICEKCPTGNIYSKKQKICKVCGAHSSANDSQTKCTCEKVSGVQYYHKNGECADPALPTCSNTGSGTSEREVFQFTTVSGFLYQLKFSGTVSVDDMLTLECTGSIIGKTPSSGTGVKKKEWCRNRSASGSVSCSSAAATKLTSSDNTYFLGDGHICRAYVTNKSGGTESTSYTGGTISVIVSGANTEYDFE